MKQILPLFAIAALCSCGAADESSASIEQDIDSLFVRNIDSLSVDSAYVRHSEDSSYAIPVESVWALLEDSASHE